MSADKMIKILENALCIQKKCWLDSKMNRKFYYFPFSWHFSGIMSASSGANFGFGFGVKLASGTGPSPGSSGHVLVELLAMLAVLCFIFTYCCWGAVGPYCRLFCRRQCGCGAENDLESTEAINPSLGPSGSSDRSGFHSHQTPTIILLPQGRMLVVDGSVFTQFQADRNGTS